MWELLNSIKTALIAIPGIDSVKIGAETGISAKDCPAVRIIPEYSAANPKAHALDNGSIQVVLLLNLKNDLEALHEQSIAFELLIRSALKSLVLFDRVDYDQDSVTVFKASILRFTFSNIQSSTIQCD